MYANIVYDSPKFIDFSIIQKFEGINPVSSTNSLCDGGDTMLIGSNF